VKMLTQCLQKGNFTCALQHQQQHQNSERRIEGLLHKADAVDKAEYERVVAAHAAAQDNSTRLLAVNTHLQADINRLQPLADQIAPLQATVQSLEVLSSIHPHFTCSTLPCNLWFWSSCLSAAPLHFK